MKERSIFGLLAIVIVFGLGVAGSIHGGLERERGRAEMKVWQDKWYADHSTYAESFYFRDKTDYYVTLYVCKSGESCEVLATYPVPLAPKPQKASKRPQIWGDKSDTVPIPCTVANGCLPSEVTVPTPPEGCNITVTQPTKMRCARTSDGYYCLVPCDEQSQHMSVLPKLPVAEVGPKQ